VTFVGSLRTFFCNKGRIINFVATNAVFFGDTEGAMLSQLNCAAYVGGIFRSPFCPCRLKSGWTWKPC
jgi:hypothetical protein